MAVKTTQEKFLLEVSDIYDAENRFLQGMQLMAQKASDKTLQTMIQDHIQQTEGHIKNLEQVYSTLGEKPHRHSCDAAAGLVTEAKKSMDEAGTDPIRDCLIGAAAAKNEHYEIASYRGLVASAQGMNQPEIASLLEQNLRQEEQTAQKLEQSAPQLLQRAKAQEGQYRSGAGEGAQRDFALSRANPQSPDCLRRPVRVTPCRSLHPIGRYTYASHAGLAGPA